MMKHLLALVIVAAVAGCTVAPKPVDSVLPSFDVGGQTSGFIGWTEDGRGIITDLARRRYNALIERYGDQFNPPLVPDDGLTPGGPIDTPTQWIISQRALVNFGRMQQWQRANR